MELNGKKILITGGSLGIGKACAKILAAAGSQVAITARREKFLQQTAAELDVFPIVGDVSKKGDAEAIIETFLNEFGALDCLINNAAIGYRGSLLELDPERMREVWEVNVLGATLLAQQAARRFVKQGLGDIVNIGSTASLKGYAGGSAYSSSKFALRSLSECWRAELRPHNVRVITIFPSEVTTAFGQPDGRERAEEPNKLRAVEIAYAVKAALEMDDRGFIPELVVHATNPF